jgi:primosomal protein N' (replication factor Y)
VQLADLALPVPLPRVFSYSVPGPLSAKVSVGKRVLCALGKRRVVGVVVATRDGEPPPNVKDVEAVLDGPSLPEDLVLFLRELAAYYLAPIGEAIRLALPPLDRETSQALAEPSLFGDGVRGVGARRIQWVVPTDALEEARKIRPNSAAILARVRASGGEPLARLPRSTVKGLVEMGLVAIESREASVDLWEAPATRDEAPAPTVDQAAAVAAIGEAIERGEARTFLVHGVTGSGKTEVYLRAIAAAKAQKRGALVLVPEIALTPQLVARFRARFGDGVAVLHSALTPRERLAMWRRLRSGEVDVAIGARSALFAPVNALGLVVVDEEHDPSFKQEDGVRYHARDMAILRAHRAGGVCVLGSATPSLESELLARTLRARKLRLETRARSQAMPRVEVVDLRRNPSGPTGDRRISLPLYRAIEETLAAKEQAILFLNRRGFAPSVRCQACGEASACPHCSVALTFHKRGGAVLRCHYCDYEAPMPLECPKCHAPALSLEGLGTEKLEDALSGAFPEARIARLDRDVASGKAIERVLARVRAREVDLLVGTQMVTKGHDLPHVTLVGVVNADAALSIPDFRAAERAFQLLVQVAGRAGRGDAPGRVLIQTFDPAHAAVAFATRHDVDGFLECELQGRRELAYPPFSRVALVRVDAIDEAGARSASARLAEHARAAAPPGVEVRGPAPAPLARLRNRFRFRVMLRAKERADLRRVLLAVESARRELPREVRAVIDVDPVQLL